MNEHVIESGDDTARATPHEWFVDTRAAIDTFRRAQSADWSRLRPDLDSWVDENRTVRG
ncbi:MAG TPA: hypothetical protein VFU35_11975 [Jatrophihabitans sp.]|nr:hypothetical protein [Jatrophihabitans sp.]